MAKKAPGPETERGIIAKGQALLAGERAPTPSISSDLDRLFDAHREQIYRLCLRMVRDPARAEELVQETLVVAYTKLPEFQPNARFGTWIYVIARNLCLNTIRKRAELLSTDGVLEVGESADEIFGTLRAEERKGLLVQASQAVLDPIEQEAIYLRYVEGLSQDAITELLELPGTGARGVLQRCRRKLGRELRRRLTEMGHASTFFREP
jgi:RNA polymerase sigma-70 factor (ECF subfamily)